jgi:hypothetical protein
VSEWLCESPVFTSKITPVNDAHHGGGEEELHGWLEPVVEAVVSTGAGLLALLGAPEAVLAAAAQGPARHVATDLARRALAWHARNAAEAVEVGMSEAGMEAEEFLRSFAASPARLELLSSVIEAATHATTEEKIRVLGGALAAGALGDDAVVDVEQLFVRALADLERPHVRLLDQLRQDPAHPLEQMRRWSAPELAHNLDLGPAVHPLIAALQRHGLIEQRQNTVPTQRNLQRIPPADVSWSITDFGLQVLDRLRSAGDES